MREQDPGFTILGIGQAVQEVGELGRKDKQHETVQRKQSGGGDDDCHQGIFEEQRSDRQVDEDLEGDDERHLLAPRSLGGSRRENGRAQRAVIHPQYDRCDNQEDRNRGDACP